MLNNVLTTVIPHKGEGGAHAHTARSKGLEKVASRSFPTPVNANLWWMREEVGNITA